MLKTFFFLQLIYWLFLHLFSVEICGLWGNAIHSIYFDCLSFDIGYTVSPKASTLCQ